MEFLVDGHTVIVDDEDAHLFNERRWRVVARRGKLYVHWHSTRNGKDVHAYLHRVITNAPKGVIVDHHDGDTFNCRRGNLRLGDKLLNARNMSKRRNCQTTSRFKGVNWRKKERRWVSVIRHGGRQHTLGYFSSEAQAALVYDLASMKFHGDQGKTNFLPLVRCSPALLPAAHPCELSAQARPVSAHPFPLEHIWR